MDLKRAWRNGFLISVVFALPISDLYDFKRNILVSTESSSRKTVQQAKNCSGADCAGYAKRTDGNDVIDAEDSGLTISRDPLSGLMLESSGSGSGSLRNAGLHFSPQDILNSDDLTGDDAQDVPDDIRHLVDLHIGSLASLPYGFGGSPLSVPGHGGSFTPAGFTDGNIDTESESLHALSDADQTEIDDTANTDTLQSVPEPSGLLLIAIGTSSVAALFHLRKPKTPVSGASMQE